MTRRIVPKVAVLLNIAALLSFIYPHDVATPIHTVAPMVEELVTGERIQALCDIVILSKEYAELYPKMLGYSHSVVYTDELLSDVVRMNIKHSRTFFLKLDWIDFFKKVVLPEIEAPFVLFTHNSDFVRVQDNEVLS